MLDRNVLNGSGLIIGTALEIRERNASRAFLDRDSVLPEVDVVVVWADPYIPLRFGGKSSQRDSRSVA